MPDQSTSRLPIWNSLFMLAWRESKACHEHAHGPSSATFAPDTLSLDKHRVLSALILVALAIEARANHLICELVDEGRVSEDVGEAARRLSPKDKWFLLPALAGRSVQLSSSSGPHQAVAEACYWRNRLMHVRYDQLQDLPSPGEVASIFRRFAEAVADMNVQLGRDASINPDIVAIGVF